jgi:hypothetical protein
MKKSLLFLVILATSLAANAANIDYSFVGITSANIAAITPASSGTKTTNATLQGIPGRFPGIDYNNVPANGVITVDFFSTPSNIQLKYNNSVAKSSLFVFGSIFFETMQSGVKLVLSNIEVGSTITINAAKSNSGAVATFSVVGANASVSNPATLTSSSTYVDLVFFATASVVTITETTGGFRMKNLNMPPFVATAVNNVLSDKGISFNGTEIINQKGISIEVYNISGKRVTSATTSISTVNFPKGVYIVRVTGSDKSLKISL